MKNLLKVLILTVVLSSCSTDDSSSNQNGNLTDAKELANVVQEGLYNLSFHYQNGKVTKVLHESYLRKHQIVYNSDGKVSRIYTEENIGTNHDNEDFEWDIIDTADYTENVYENGKLVAIMSGSNIINSFTYEGDLLVQEMNLIRTRTYTYNSDNEMTHYILDETVNGGSIHMKLVEFDDKVNPFYKMWNEDKLKLPFHYGSFLSFYPHNLIRQVGADDNEVDYISIYTSDEDGYPVSANTTSWNGLGGNDRSYFFEYN